MSDFVVWFLNNPYTLGVLCFLLVMVPIIGIWVVHSTDKK
jgi:predicted PurR-regulated permease PerM